MKQMPISKLNDRLNGDMTVRGHERSNAGVRLPGRNDIRVERRKRFLTLSLLRAHFYTGVFHTSYVRSARLSTRQRCWCCLRHCVSVKGLPPLRCYAAIPAHLWLGHDFSNHALTASLKKYIYTQDRLLQRRRSYCFHEGGNDGIHTQPRA